MSVTPETLNKINSLRQGIEAATGESYPDLTAGVQALKNGYGQGGGTKEEQEKTVDITANGTVEVVPDEGKTLSKVTANVNVASTGEVGKPYIDTSKITDFTRLCANDRMNDFLDKLDTSNGTNFYYMFDSSKNLQSIPQLNTSKGINFSYMFYFCSNLKTVSQFDTSNGTNLGHLFQQCKNLEQIPQLDTSKCTDFTSMFNGCGIIETIPQIDTSVGTNFSYMFSSCVKLKTIPQLDTSNGTNFADMFYYCEKLETVSLTTAKSNFATRTFQNCTALKNLTIGEGWNVNIYLHYSNELTVESLHGMIENLADLTGQTAKIFQIGATNLAKIDEAHITMLNNKNWNYS